MENKNQIISSVVMVLVVVLIISAFAYFNKNDGTKNNLSNTDTATSTVKDGDSSMDIFAKCLTGKDITMYGAAWCSHCTSEKKNFGDSFKYVQYVECPDNIQLCTDKGVVGYPTWIDGAGVKHEGEQGLSGLASITGCVLPK
jgi:hypothetical protein